MAIRIATTYKTEIVSADSRQFYREISIGTAKPDNEELAAVPHHFINNKSVSETYSAGDFERDTLAILSQLFTRHDVVVMVGGSGLYLKAVWEGLDSMPKGNEKLRLQLQQLHKNKGIEALQNSLRELNPEKLEKIDLQNPQRLMRAIEIAGQQIERKEQAGKLPREFSNVKIGLNMERTQLYNRINARVDSMLQQGLEEECRGVVDVKEYYALRTVGYQEIFDYFDGKISKSEAVKLIKQHTRNFAKRQLTWFRRDSDIQWFGPDDFEQIIQYIESIRKA